MGLFIDLFSNKDRYDQDPHNNEVSNNEDDDSKDELFIAQTQTKTAGVSFNADNNIVFSQGQKWLHWQMYLSRGSQN